MEKLFRNSHVKLHEFMYWLFDMSTAAANDLWKQILEWMEMIVDYGDFWQKVNPDELMIPFPKAAKGNTRKLPKPFKRAVVKAYCSGKLGKSGAQVVRMAKRFRHMKVGTGGLGLQEESANKWAEPEMRTYLHDCFQKFARALQPVYSLSWDGTRLSGLDHIFGTFFSPSSQVACWSPPIAPRILILKHAKSAPVQGAKTDCY